MGAYTSQGGGSGKSSSLGSTDIAEFEPQYQYLLESPSNLYPSTWEVGTSILTRANV